MVLLSVLIVLGLIQLWGSGAPLHHDLWFQRWVTFLRSGQLAATPGAVLVIALSVPLLALIFFLHIVTSTQAWLSLFVSVPVLLYCLGRGEYSSAVQAYLLAWSGRDWPAAVAAARKLGAAIDSEYMADNTPQHWPDLHRRMLSASGYRGFERMFAVLFWFVLLGPAGALLYRLSALYTEWAKDQNDGVVAERWLWLLEWPAVRILGISFALTGNFVGCFQQWRDFLICTESSSATVLMYAVRGALSLGERVSLEVSDNELRALQSLLSRTLLLWVCLLAIFTLFM